MNLHPPELIRETSKRASLFADSMEKEWRNKLRLSMSHDLNVYNRKSFDVTQNGILRLANGYELDNQGVKRAQYNSSSNVSKSGIFNKPMSDEPLPLTPDDFLILRSIGSGNTGTVALGLHIPTLTLCALKTTEISNDEARHQMAKELDTLYNISNLSINLISFMGAYFQEGKVTFALQFMNRGSLQDLVDDYGPLPENIIKDILKQVLDGLITVHSNRKMHRDIKPQNILLNSTGEVKIADFGILGTEDAQDMLNTFCGTTLYMSPERLAGGSYTNAGDIWSLGLVLIVCATGKFPYVFDKNRGGYFGVTAAIMDLPSPNIDSTDYSDDLKDFVNMCMLKDPFERWAADQLKNHPFLRDVENCIKWWTPLTHVDTHREEQCIADLKYLVEQASSSEFDSELEQQIANRHLIENVAPQMGIADVLRFFPELENVPILEDLLQEVDIVEREASISDPGLVSSDQMSVPHNSVRPLLTNSSESEEVDELAGLVDFSTLDLDPRPRSTTQIPFNPNNNLSPRVVSENPIFPTIPRSYSPETAKSTPHSARAGPNHINPEDSIDFDDPAIADLLSPHVNNNSSSSAFLSHLTPVARKNYQAAPLSTPTTLKSSHIPDTSLLDIKSRPTSGSHELNTSSSSTSIVHNNRYGQAVSRPASGYLNIQSDTSKLTLKPTESASSSRRPSGSKIPTPTETRKSSIDSTIKKSGSIDNGRKSSLNSTPTSARKPSVPTVNRK